MLKLKNYLFKMLLGIMFAALLLMSSPWASQSLEAAEQIACTHPCDDYDEPIKETKRPSTRP